MIINGDVLRKFENDLIASDSLPYEKAVKILDSMYQEALSLGIYPPADPLEGIEEKTKLAKVLHGCLKK